MATTVTLTTTACMGSPCPWGSVDGNDSRAVALTDVDRAGSALAAAAHLGVIGAGLERVHINLPPAVVVRVVAAEELVGRMALRSEELHLAVLHAGVRLRVDPSMECRRLLGD